MLCFLQNKLLNLLNTESSFLLSKWLVTKMVLHPLEETQIMIGQTDSQVILALLLTAKSIRIYRKHGYVPNFLWKFLCLCLLQFTGTCCGDIPLPPGIVFVKTRTFLSCKTVISLELTPYVPIALYFQRLLTRLSSLARRQKLSLIWLHFSSTGTPQRY